MGNHPTNQRGARFQAPDVIVIGAGIIGLCSATAIARRGLRVLVAGESRSGEASRAAAGMLAPSVEKSSGPAHKFACAARDFYPAYLDDLADLTGIRVALNRMGILQLALSDRGVKGLRKTAAETAQWIDKADLAALEPALGHARGAMFNPDDGAVDNVGLMTALEAAADSNDHIERTGDSAKRVASHRDSVSVTFAAGRTIDAAFVVLAPGAWGGQIEGAPLLDAVRPSRGQIVSYDAIGLNHVVYGPRGYLVPRTAGTLPASTIAGSTMENAGFVSETTPEGLARITSAAAEIAPVLSGVEPSTAWAGLRPVTPDMLPMLGADPSNPRVVYACGHSRNGILMAPLTGETVAAIVTGEGPLHDLSQFHPARFSG